MTSDLALATPNSPQTIPSNQVSISVIIPVKNDADRLSVCLKSLAAIPAHQVVVIDNGSTDHSLQVANQSGCKTLSFPEAKVGAVRNRGVSISDGAIIVFLDSDHEVTKDWLQRGIDLLLSNDQIVAVGSHYLPPENGTWVQRVWAIHRLRGDSPREVDWLGSGNLFVRRSDFLKVNGFREDLTAAEDVDLCHRLRNQLNGRILCDQAIRNVHHGEPKTLVDFFWKEYWRGSSGLRAWSVQGFPLRDLPSFLWPLWHLGNALAILAFAVCAAVFYNSAWLLGSVSTLGLMILPSLFLSLRTCWNGRRIDSLAPLATLYLVYGLARAAALFKA